MSMTLNLVNRLLEMGQTLHDLGRDHDAFPILSRLSSFRELPAEVAEETQVCLAEIELRRGNHRRARRHLAAALRHQPDCGHYHYLMAVALEADDKADPERAVEHYRRALKFDPNHASCLGDYGLLAIQRGRTEEGVKCLRRLVDQAPDDPEAVHKLITGLRLAGRSGEARAALLAARFRNSRDRRFLKQWNDFQFQELRQAQQTARRDQGTEVASTDGPVLLPFELPVRDNAVVNPSGTILRLDSPESPPPPHLPRSSRLPSRRHV